MKFFCCSGRDDKKDKPPGKSFENKINKILTYEKEKKQPTSSDATILLLNEKKLPHNEEFSEHASLTSNEVAVEEVNNPPNTQSNNSCTTILQHKLHQTTYFLEGGVGVVMVTVSTGGAVALGVISLLFFTASVGGYLPFIADGYAITAGGMASLAFTTIGVAKATQNKFTQAFSSCSQTEDLSFFRSIVKERPLEAGVDTALTLSRKTVGGGLQLCCSR